MSDTTYNGWTNRETWLVNVWFNPESKADVNAAREILEEQEDSLEGCLRDMSGLSRVNWEELLDVFEDEDEEDEDGDDE